MKDITNIKIALKDKTYLCINSGRTTNDYDVHSIEYGEQKIKNDISDWYDSYTNEMKRIDNL